MNRLTVATTNAGKVGEIAAVLEGLEGWAVEPLPPGLPVPEETGATFLENATLKAEFYSRRVPGWVLADDSGVVVEALGGRPGIHSSRYAPTDAERNRKLLAELEGVPAERRGARFVCALALAREGHVVWTVERFVAGRITEAPRGTRGWGYDPILWVPELGRTLGEAAPEVKNRISHRGQALAAMRAYLEGEAPG